MNKVLDCLCENIAKHLNSIMLGDYKQFKQIDRKGMITVQCPSCSRHFGLSTTYVESIGEVSFLHAYTCPYCSKSYTLKDP